MQACLSAGMRNSYPDTPSPSSTAADRRVHLRYETSEPATAVVNGVPLPCRLTDMSMGGALLEGELPLSSGSRFVLEILDLPPIQVKVVHSGDRYFGVQFQELEIVSALISVWLRRRVHGT